MIGILRSKIDSFFGRGKFSTSVPVMDGPLQPNHLLEAMTVLASAPGLDNVVHCGNRLYFSSGASLLRSNGPKLESVSTFNAAITCLASDGYDALAVGLDGTGVKIRGGRHDGYKIETVAGDRLICPTAALFQDPDTLVIASGSTRHAATQWKHDLMVSGCSGSVWRIKLDTGTTERIADKLAFPFGLAEGRNGELLVSEAWRHRIIRLDDQTAGVPPVPVLEDLPGYPARLIKASRGGYWLAIFAPRNQLVEFVLQERGYCEKMMAGVDPELWIAPKLSTGASFREPLQGGSVKQMGTLKPWAPSLSYGLVVLLDADLLPKASWHSRADGSMHGVTSLCEFGSHVVLTAKGPGHALRLDMEPPIEGTN